MIAITVCTKGVGKSIVKSQNSRALLSWIDRSNRCRTVSSNTASLLGPDVSTITAASDNPNSWTPNHEVTRSMELIASNILHHPMNGLQSRFVPFEKLQHGFGTIVASCNKNTKTTQTSTSSNNNNNNVNHYPQQHHRASATHLTTISHKSPVRLLPLKPAGTAACVTVAHYGGGMMAGDHAKLDVTVEDGASLVLQTQSSNRIYKQRNPKSGLLQPSVQSLHAVVGPNALLVSVPDPVSLQADCMYQQHNIFKLADMESSSLVAVDWISAGRVTSGERWSHHQLRTVTEVFLDNGTYPILVDAQHSPMDMDLMLSQSLDHHPPQPLMNAVATVILYGESVEDAIQRFVQLQRTVCAQHTAVRIPSITTNNPDRSDYDNNPKLNILLNQQLSNNGQLVVGMSSAAVLSSSTQSKSHRNIYTVRLIASSNEDLYRILHFCLQPLHQLGDMECYQHRINSSQSAPSPTGSMPSSTLLKQGPSQSSNRVDVSHAPVNPLAATATATASTTPTSSISSTSSSLDSYWTAYMLVDSALPTGSFAHSAGLEAVAQQNLTNHNIGRVVSVSTRSAVQLLTPLIRATHRLAMEVISKIVCVEAVWHDLDRYAQAILATNTPACRASLDQGRNLLRISIELLQQDRDQVDRRLQFLMTLQQAFNHTNRGGHVSTIFGVVTAFVGLSEEDACHMFGYCVARDIVSSAVRLNLIGPTAGQVILRQTQHSAEDGIAFVADRMKDQEGIQNDVSLLLAAVKMASGGCTPVLEAAHTNHDLLATRLFRT